MSRGGPRIVCRGGHQFLIERGRTGDAPEGWIVRELPSRDVVSGTFRLLRDAVAFCGEIGSGCGVG